MPSYDELAVQADAELNPVQGSTRYQYMGFWDGQHSKAGEPTSWDSELVERFHERQRQLGLPGVWRSAHWYPNRGTQRDIDYMILEW